MDINLPLILVLASFAGIVIWLVDQLYLKAKRAEDEEAHWLINETRSLLPIVLIVLILRSFVAEPFQIPSSSMEPTLLVGDFILVNKFTYGIRLPVTRTKVLDLNEPKRGDVMVFFPPNDKRYFIKRVIGLPGDLIEYQNKQLFINGELQQTIVSEDELDLLRRQLLQENLAGVEHAIYHTANRPSVSMRMLVKEGEYFMMGDNRDNSKDSRYWGTVPEENIVGKAFAIWMHWKDWSSLPSFSRVGSFQ